MNTKTATKGKFSTDLPRKKVGVEVDVDLPVIQLRHCGQVKIVADHADYIPTYQTEGSACADLVANLESNIQDGLSVEVYEGEKIVRIFPGQTVKIDCGFSMAIPKHWEAQIRARSSLAAKGLIVPNGPGTVDSDYRSRIMVLLSNISKGIISIKHKQRIGQLALKPVYHFEFQETDSLDTTARGAGGFGSTGQSV